MIIKGKSRDNAAQAADYFTKQGDNERVSLIDIQGTLSQDVHGACREMAGVAGGSRCGNFLYHASINPAEGDILTPEQWEKSVEILEKKLKLEDHQRIIIEHEKEGRVHRHILWNRVDQETIKAQRMGWNYVKHEQTAREIENLFDLEKVQGVHTLENGEVREKGDFRASYAPTRPEIEQGKRTGVNVYKWKAECKELAAGTDGSGAQIKEVLENHGHFFALGDRMNKRGSQVPIVVLDPSGTPHRLSGVIGLRTKPLKEAFKDIDLAALPCVAEAQERQKEQQEKEKQPAVERKPFFENINIVKRFKDEYGKAAAFKAKQYKTLEAAATKAEDPIDFMIDLQEKGLQVGVNKFGSLSAVASNGLEISMRKVNKDLKEQVLGLESMGICIPTTQEIKDEQKLARKERRELAKERREEWRKKTELYHSRLGATLYGSGGMESQQKAALRHNREKQKVAGKPRPQHPEYRSKVLRSSLDAAIERFNKGEKAPAAEVRGHDDVKTKPNERYSQRESLLKDIAPELAKENTKEQTDRKKRKAAKMSSKELLSTDFSKFAKKQESGLEQDNSWDRERER